MSGRWLLAWHWGDGQGHWRGLHAIACARAALHGTGADAECVIAVPRLDQVPAALRAQAGARWVQGPAQPLGEATAPAWTYPQLVAAQWATPQGAVADAQAWRVLIEAERPTLLVANHAPMALVAARAAGLPCAQVGTGFTCPPPRRPFPVFRDWYSADPSALRAAEARADALMAQALQALGAPPADLATLLAVPTLLWTLPELDHYAGSRTAGQAAFVGALMTPDQGQAARCWTGGARYRVLAYLRSGYTAWREALAAVAQRGDCELLAYVAGADPGEAKALPGLVTEPLAWHRLLNDADLVLCHAGAAAASQAVQHGVPVLALPEQAEQFVLARRLAALGIGEWALPAAGPVDWDALVDALLAGAHRGRAATLAGAYAAWPPTEGALRMAGALARITAPAGRSRP